MVQSLPGFLNLSLNVCSLCQVLGDVYTEVLEATPPLHRGPTDHKRGIGPLLSLPEVYIFSSPVLLLCVHTRYNPFAHPSCTSLLFILLFIKSQYTVFAHLIVLHFLFYCTFYSYFSFLPYICSCVVLLLYNFYFYSFALSTERTWFDLHFTSDYTLYNLLCHK